MLERKYFHDLFGGEANSGDIAGSVILVNDPLSVESLTEAFEKRISVANHYQYRVVTGIMMEQPVTVCSTGIGGGATSIAVDNLVRLGAKTLLYVDAGSSGISDPGAYLASGAIRKDGASLDYVRSEFPAVADPEVLTACLAAGRDLALAIAPALFWASAVPMTPAEVQLCEKYNSSRLDSGRKFVPPIVASGPEAATILTLSTIYRVRASAIYIGVQSLEDVFEAIRQYFHLALRAVNILVEWDLRKERLGWKVMTPPITVK